MTGPKRLPLLFAFFATAAVLLASAPVSAELSLLEGEGYDLRLGGYVGSFSAYQWTDYDTGGLTPDQSGINAGVLRLEWKAGLSDYVALDVQNRFFWSIAPAASAGANPVGLGSTVAPERTVNLRSEIVDANGVLIEHDIDRLALSIFTPFADITLGRQAVTWGNSTLFTVADLWTQFSPFELDTSQKRGVDAVRAITYPTGTLEFDAILVDRGDLDQLSGGVRAGWSLGNGDYYLGAGRNYDRIWGLMGLSLDLDVFRGHSEIALPFDPETKQLALPRATIGVDYFSTKFTALLEYHFNGPGSSSSQDYVLAFSEPEVVRGERYFVGRHYLGLAGSYVPWEDLLSFSLSAITNLNDPSVLVSPSLIYQLSQNVNATLGGYFGLGSEPSLAPGPIPLVLGSEFGLYPNVLFLQLAGFF